MRVVVITGSRRWQHQEPLERVLRGAELAILGDAPGADTVALGVCLANDIIPAVYCASRHRARELGTIFGHAVGIHLVSDWDQDGRHGPDNAGHLRNHGMRRRAVAERAAGMQVDCYAAPLPGSIGTHHCTRILRSDGFVVETLLP